VERRVGAVEAARDRIRVLEVALDELASMPPTNPVPPVTNARTRTP
jgi:hypothetical protein